MARAVAELKVQIEAERQGHRGAAGTPQLAAAAAAAIDIAVNDEADTDTIAVGIAIAAPLALPPPAPPAHRAATALRAATAVPAAPAPTVAPPVPMRSAVLRTLYSANGPAITVKSEAPPLSSSA